MEHLTERQEKLLTDIVEIYIKTAQPVGSKLIGEQGGLDWSPATIRHEMAELEELGLLFQPHTSAGRVPTDRAYQLYNVRSQRSKVGVLKQEEIQALHHAYQGQDGREQVKYIAKEVAEISGDAVVVGFGRDDFYYTGLSNLFSKPEFAHMQLVVNMSQLLDRLDGIVLDLATQAQEETRILIGSESPFGPQCSVVFAKGMLESSLLAIFGLSRMDYGKNRLLVEEARKLMTIRQLADE